MGERAATEHRPADPDAITSDAPVRRNGRRPRRSTALALLAVTALVVAATVWTIRAPRDDEVRLAAGADAAAGAPEPDDADDVVQVVRELLDPTVPVDQRVGLVQDHRSDGVPVRQLIESVDAAGERAGASAHGVEAAARSVHDDVAIVDVELDLDGSYAASARLQSFVLHEEDGAWRLSGESLCGLAAAVQMLGSTTLCEDSGGYRRLDGAARVGQMLRTATGRAVEAADPIEVGYWTDRPVALGGAVWAAEYPEMEAGGGGPVGPAELVRTDMTTGTVTARVGVAGTDARFVAAGGTLWVLHLVTDGDGSTGQVLTSIDPAAARVTGEVPDPGGAVLVAGGDGVWVGGDGPSVHRYEPGADRPVATADIGSPLGLSTLSGTDGELWARDGERRARVADAASGAVHRVDTPPGELVGSGGRIWAVDRTAAVPVARLLAGDGTVEAELELPLPADGDLWGDGRGGLWVSGSALAEPNGSSSGFRFELVARPFAAHVAPVGHVTATWWREGPGRDTYGRFVPVGEHLAFWDGTDLELLGDPGPA